MKYHLIKTKSSKIKAKFLALCLYSVILFLISCAENSKIEVDKNPATSGLYDQSLLHDGVARKYLLYLPKGYTSSTVFPVVFNFHGFGSTAEEHMTYADMRSLADKENFILLYPEGTLLNGATHWNAGLDTSNNKSDADDFGFVASLLSELSDNYSIDSKRIYACGYSNGGFFSYALACYLSDKIAAVGSVSGTMLEETYRECNPSHPTPVINIHGTSDVIVPYQGGNGLKAIPDVITYWVNFNGIENNPEINSQLNNGTTTEQYIYSDSTTQISVVHYKIIGGGHVWFDMNFNGFNTNDLLWNFLSAYNLDGFIP
ncbi:PHB depolymerase family esterase [Tenacibaculum sp. SG-28]|uniref:extracellular catalytic domain type 1 short-chain-length polyhydroxyalkanoate depolymerase n=1 Tax=Tenacibaculum sp. SG-28 TaxID=754426 RepID=UPI000CF37A30|nr:PHB depolymerase family esterase [Tenacibaculum sp. SG-28]PQJ22916.1 hypothetical protein BSU00_01060 [Tenacibaculum sp. SG-28]